MEITNQQAHLAILQGLAGNYHLINSIERQLFQDSGVRPYTIDADGNYDEEGGSDATQDHEITRIVISPTGRCTGFIWHPPCHTCEGTGICLDDEDQIKKCETCDGERLQMHDACAVFTDLDGLIIEHRNNQDQMHLFDDFMAINSPSKPLAT